MTKFFLIVFAVLCTSCFIFVSSDPVDVPVTYPCLSCLCGVASNCDTDNPCQGNACGIYRITRDYWNQAGKLTYNIHDPDNPKSFEKCATNFFCATFTVQNYMKRFMKDCNNDGIINCDDYLAIHFLGPNNCNQPWPEIVIQRYETCKAKYQK